MPDETETQIDWTKFQHNSQGFLRDRETISGTEREKNLFDCLYRLPFHFIFHFLYLLLYFIYCIFHTQYLALIINLCLFSMLVSLSPKNPWQFSPWRRSWLLSVSPSSSCLRPPAAGSGGWGTPSRRRCHTRGWRRGGGSSREAPPPALSAHTACGEEK